MISNNLNSLFIGFNENAKNVDLIKKSIADCCLTNNYREIDYLLDATRCTDDELIDILGLEEKDDTKIPVFIAFNIKKMDALKSLLDISLRRGVLDRVLALKNHQDSTLLHLLCYFGSPKVLNDWFCRSCPKESIASALKINGFQSYPPLFFAVHEFKKDTLKMFLTLCPEALFFTDNSNMSSLLGVIIICGNHWVIDCIDEILGSSGFKDYWSTLLNIKTAYGSNPLYELLRPLKVERKDLEELRIETLKKIELRIGREAVVSLLSHANNEGSVLHGIISNGWLKIAGHIIQNYPEVGDEVFSNGQNIWHRLASISKLTTDKSKDEKSKVDFFKKHFSQKYINCLNEKNIQGFTPLYFARYIAKFHELADCFQNAGADAIVAQKLHYSKLLAHVWSIKQKKGGDPKNHEAYPYLEFLSAWMPEATIDEMQKSLLCFLTNSNMEPEDISLAQDIFAQVNTAFFAYLSVHTQIKNIKDLIDQNKLWVIPIQFSGHCSLLVGFGNHLIYCDRAETTILWSDGVTVDPPRLSIEEIPSKLTESQIGELLNFKGNAYDLLVFFEDELECKHKGIIRLKKQPADTCAWTNSKTGILAAFLIKGVQNAEAIFDGSLGEDGNSIYKKARSYYSKWSNFTRWDILAQYKAVVEASNPLVEAVESKALLTHAIKLIKQNPAILESDPGLKAAVDLHLSSKDPKKLDELIHRFGKRDERRSIVQALHEVNNTWLNTEMDQFSSIHHLEKLHRNKSLMALGCILE